MNKTTMTIGLLFLVGCGGASANGGSGDGSPADVAVAQLKLFAPVDAPVAGQVSTLSAQMFVQNPPAQCSDGFSLGPTHTCTPAPEGVRFDITSVTCEPSPCELTKTESFGGGPSLYPSVAISVVPQQLPTTVHVEAVESDGTARSSSQSLQLQAQ